jgi:endonuclease-3 related protein
MDVLSHDTALFNEFHALFVALGKECCRKGGPICEGCPLERW